jgi:BolA protein
MQIQTQIILKLTDTFTPVQLEVINESHMHSVPKNSETHFKVTVVSDHFVAQQKVARHQAVYGCLSEEMANPVHALAIHAYTPDEWQARNQSAPQSPDCLGGS